MRKSRYHVVFLDGSSVEEWALSADQAKILAQAERINKGLDYDVKEVNYIGPV